MITLNLKDEARRRAYLTYLISLGRMYEQILIFSGSEPLPENMRTDDHYIALGELSLQNLEDSETSDYTN